MKTTMATQTIECRGMKFNYVKSRYTSSLHDVYVEREQRFGKICDKSIHDLVKYGYWKLIKGLVYPQFLHKNMVIR